MTQAVRFQLTYFSGLFEKALKKIEDEVRPLKPSIIVAVTRGGLIPAGYLAHSLDIRDIRLVQAAKYDDDQQVSQTGEPEVDVKFTACRPCLNEVVLVVDDILDTGGTLSAVLQQLQLKCRKVICAVLVWKMGVPNQIIPPSFVWGLRVDADWVVFPWEASNEGQ